ncbi:MAG: hypothetical protein JRE57_13600 [Deltaproteobacteria bacterium]|nr:hypothetical protein [Deltaproteobacteria bacterium]
MGLVIEVVGHREIVFRKGDLGSRSERKLGESTLRHVCGEVLEDQVWDFGARDNGLIHLALVLPGFLDDERHPDRRLVDVLAVVDQLVFAEVFPVVRRQDDQSVVVQSELLQLLEQVLEFLVDDVDGRVVLIRDVLNGLGGIGLLPLQDLRPKILIDVEALPIVPGFQEARVVGSFARVVGVVGVDVVEEQEEGFLPAFFKPLEGHLVEAIRVGPLAEVGLEALVDLEALFQVDVVADQSGRLESLVAKDLREGDVMFAEYAHLGAFFVDLESVCTVLEGIQARHQRCVGRKSPGG